ncbi:MAG: hypothetical protein WC607_01870 [Candidatus Micrarchaeia archaeon]
MEEIAARKKELAEKLKNKTTLRKGEAAAELMQLPHTIEELTAYLKNPEQEVRIAAAAALVKHPDATQKNAVSLTRYKDYAIKLVASRFLKDNAPPKERTKWNERYQRLLYAGRSEESIRLAINPELMSPEMKARYARAFEAEKKKKTNKH